jgi:RNA polymerase sigma factor (sigma-70 family)
VEHTASFTAERDRLIRIASRILGDRIEAEDVVQQAWIRLDGAGSIDNVPAWLTTVTTRLCLDRLRARVPMPVDDVALGLDDGVLVADPADEVALAETVGVALQVVLDRLTPAERVSFVLHDTFSFDFTTIATLLDTSPAAARKLASRARAKVALPRAEDPLADWEVVDAFLSAARNGDFDRLIRLLAPDAAIDADVAAVAAGTPARIVGRQEVATFFNGAAKAALSAFVEGRPGAAWFLRGEAMVAFDFTVEGGVVTLITFRAQPEVLVSVQRRHDSEHTPTRKDDR